jgi:hypothetical protein
MFDHLAVSGAGALAVARRLASGAAAAANDLFGGDTW